MFLNRVERWRPIAAAEINRGRYPFPVELILALTQYESGGNAGATNPKSGASGLIQVMPGTLKTYNRNSAQKVSLATMRSSTELAGRLQLRVGLWVLGRYWRSAFRWLSKHNQTTEVPLHDLVVFGDGFYAAGPARVKDLARNLKPANWSTWSARYPKSNITQHGDRVWDLTDKHNPIWDLQSINNWVQRDDSSILPPVIQTNMGGFLIALVIMAAASLYFEKGSSNVKTNRRTT